MEQRSGFVGPSHASTYEYQPLRPDDLEIRLVELLPSEKSDNVSQDAIHCHLHHISLLAQPLYEALSYHWGSEIGTMPINLEGRSFSVTKNLEEALGSLVLPDKSRLLWIDAICINQRDNIERTEQVQQMAKIFTDAIRVLVWLGLGDEDTKAAFQRVSMEEQHWKTLVQGLEIIRSASPGSDGQIVGPEQNNSDLESEEELPILRRPTLGLPKPSEHEIAAIDRLFQHPWWERVWIIQEASVAKDLLVVCGGQTLSWESFSQIYPDGRDETGRLQRSEQRGSIEPWRRLNETRLAWKNYPPAKALRSSFKRLDGLTELISNSRSSNATDSRDKIYALLGISDNDTIVPDYSIPPTQVYLHYAEKVLDPDPQAKPVRTGAVGPRVGALRLLNYCLPSPQLPGIPSWVPDWSSHSDNPTYSMSSWYTIGNFPFLENSARASADHTHWQGSIQSKSEPYTLTIRGFVADRVQTIGNLIKLSKPFLTPLFEAYLTLRTVEESRTSNAAFVDIVAKTRKLAQLAAQWDKAANSQSLDGHLYQKLQPLFDISSRPPVMEMTARVLHDERLTSISFILHSLYKAKSSRRYFTTEQGKFGLGRADIQEGDLVCIMLGGSDAYILRDVNGHHVFVGNCYCDGLMLGEGMEDLETGKFELQDFVLH